MATRKARVYSVEQKAKMEYDAYMANLNAIKKAEADAKQAYEIAQQAEKAKQAKRQADFKKINDAYKLKLSKNPFTEINKSNNPAFRRSVSQGIAYKFNSDWTKQSQNYKKNAKQAKIESERNTRYQHLKEDGRTLKSPAPNSGFNWKEYNRKEMWRYDARKLNPRYHGGNLVLAVAKENYLRGMYDYETYSQVVGGGSRAVKAEQKAQAERSLAQSRARNKAEVIQDRQKWNDTANEFFQTKKQNDADFFNNVVEIVPNYDKMTQKEYTKALREGKVNLATALLNQRTAGGYTGPNTVNIETFLTERGYDINKPEEIPDSIFKPEKQLKARAQASKAVKNNSEMGDLRLLANKYKKRNFGPNQIFNLNKKTQTKKFKANDPLEFMGPTNPKKIENFKLMDNQPLNLSMASDMFGRNMKTGEIQRLKTVGETTSPEMQFFGQFIQGSRNTFDSYGNMLTNTGNFLTGKPQQELARPPVQDQFFGALIDSTKNTFEGEGKDGRSKDPMGDFFNTQQKRIDRVGYGQVAGELTTEALFWALPVGGIAKIPKIAKGFFSPTVNTIKKSDNFIPGSDFMKLEGKTKNVGWADQIGAFFGPKGPKGKAPISQPFLSSSVSLGKGTTKQKGKKPGNNFFSGSSGSGKKPGNFFDEPPKTTKTNTGLELIVKTKPLPKPKPNTFKSYPIQLGKTTPKIKTKPKPKQDFFKPQVIPKQKLKLLPKTKLKQKQKQQFFKPIPLITPKLKQKQKVKQSEQFFKPIPKLTPKLTPKLKEKKKYQQTGIIAPYFPPTAKSTGMFLPPLPFFRQGGRRNRLTNRKRPAKKAFTAWNVNTKQVGSFLKGPTYKKSRSDYVFKDLDARTKKAKKEKDYDYLDFF